MGGMRRHTHRSGGEKKTVGREEKVAAARKIPYLCGLKRGKCEKLRDSREVKTKQVIYQPARKNAPRTKTDKKNDMEKESKELVKHCRYYKGESNNPFEGKDSTKAALWLYERTWVMDFNNDNGDALRDYNSVGLGDFEMFDDTPLLLKALLFNRYAKTAYSLASAVEGFKAFYHKYYKD